jgi:hypothetical protein
MTGRSIAANSIDAPSSSNALLGCTLVDPQFVNCRWVVSGPAQTTFELMAALFRAGASDLVEATFDQIRGEKNGRVPIHLGERPRGTRSGS